MFSIRKVVSENGAAFIEQCKNVIKIRNDSKKMSRYKIEIIFMIT